jgi:hypothetical protein
VRRSNLSTAAASGLSQALDVSTMAAWQRCLSLPRKVEATWQRPQRIQALSRALVSVRRSTSSNSAGLGKNSDGSAASPLGALLDLLAARGNYETRARQQKLLESRVRQAAAQSAGANFASSHRRPPEDSRHVWKLLVPSAKWIGGAQQNRGENLQVARNETWLA